MSAIIEQRNQLNITLNQLIKNVLNYEDKELDINTILLSIRFPEELSNFDELTFKSDIKHAYKCIKIFKSKNKKINTTKYIEEIEKYVLSNLNENNEEDLDKDFFTSLKNILNMELDEQSQIAIGYFIKKIFDNDEYKYILDIFDKNLNNLNIIKNIIIKHNIFNDERFMISLYIIIELISKNNDLSKYLRIFLSYDMEKQLSFIVNNTDNLLKYVSIINKDNTNVVLNEILRNHIRYIILYIENKDEL